MRSLDTLLAQMTLPEKLGQLTMAAASSAVTGPVIVGDSTAAIRDGTIGNLLNLLGAREVKDMQRIAVEQSRLGIPLLIGFDALHGHRTAFPIPLAEAASFDPRLWAQTARAAALEATEDGVNMTFAPMLDVARDPRWGRSAEGPGEDPWVAARLAEAKVHGFQGNDLGAADAVASVAKHFCAYGAVTAGRDYATVEVSERTVHEVYLPPFAAAVAAGVAAIMPAFTDLSGIPLTAHRALLQGWLRSRLNFDGVIVSDYNAIGELMHHGVADDLAHAATLALKAGVDIDMMANAYRHGLPEALQRGWVTMAEIDAAVRRVLTLKQRLGLFRHPFGRGGRSDAAAVAARRTLARTAAARAIVMLKNDGDVLPLAAGSRRIAVVGPLADAMADMRGPWWGAAPAEGSVTVWKAMHAEQPGTTQHAAGVDIGDGGDGIPAAIAACASSDVIVVCVGESAAMSGEAASRAHLGLPGRQGDLVTAVFDHAKLRGVPVIVVVFSGRPLVIPAVVERADAVLAAWFLGCEAGNAIADVVFGRVGPSGRTPVTWPRDQGQIPIFYSERSGGRPFDAADHYTSKYLDVPNTPLFPFGHGLTYGRCRYANLRLPPAGLGARETAVVRVDVTNDGARDADETVFLFVHRRQPGITRPALELKGFGRVHLAPGETATVTLLLPIREVRMLDETFSWVDVPGDVDVLVGPCADRATLLAGTMTVTV